MQEVGDPGGLGVCVQMLNIEAQNLPRVAYIHVEKGSLPNSLVAFSDFSR